MYLKKHNLPEGVILPLVSAENVLNQLNEGLIERGVFPIENSNGGIVIEAVYAMAKYQFQIEEMFELDIHHTLLVKKGVTASQINSISSHDQALKQCRMYIKRKWPEVDIVPYADTAQAAIDLQAGLLPETTAIIAAKQCAKLYDLDIIEESIQDLKFNYTTFVVAKK